MPERSRAHAGFGRAIKRLRDVQGISQEELGFRSRLHRTYIGGIERGERNPSFMNIVKIADALEVSGSELLALGEEMAQGLDDDGSPAAG